ncbi:MAG TPA: signal peptidase I [Paucimonas sp.]|nr:signal peptidase I [Paucimonas sp.]
MKNFLRNNRGFLVFMLLFGVFRTAIADWNPIPSGSMHPNLLEGDVVFVNRIAYDLKLPLTDRIVVRLDEPRRGDIVTFSSPLDGTRLIKRIVALPGDTVEMRAKRLIVNGRQADYDDPAPAREALEHGHTLPALQTTERIGAAAHTIQWQPGVAARDDFGPVVVPPDQFVMLGDNRDNSADSRYIGFVPRALLIGRAERVLVSADILAQWQPRFERFGWKLR